jgi:hypothetical protein
MEENGKQVGICQIVQLFQVVTGFMARFTNVQFAKLTIKLSREKAFRRMLGLGS